MLIRWERGPTRCRICGYEGYSILEFDAYNLAEWERIRENMECRKCGNMACEFTEPRPALPADWVNPLLN